MSSCQHEPPFPGMPTVVFSIRYPDLTAHLASAACPLEVPHAISDCGEWDAVPSPLSGPDSR